MIREPRLIAAGVAVAAFLAAATARAEAPGRDLMDRLAEHAEAFEQMRNHASFTITAELDEKDGDGKTTSTKTGAARVEADGHATHVTVLRYAEDGKDLTLDAQKKARDGDAKRAHRSDEERLHIPFLTRERDKYVFDEVEHDPADPARVRITFVPRSPTEHTIEGSTWVDARAGRLVSAGFRVSRTPMFVDYVHFTVEFGSPTSLGPAVSHVTIDGGGGIWFFHKRFVGNATLSDYRITP